MSSRPPSALAGRAIIFAALGDQTRLALLSRLGNGRRYSISQLAEGTSLTRQAITKHLRVLERARVVHAQRSGRESLYALNPKPIRDLASYLETVSKRWDLALARLKDLVESED